MAVTLGITVLNARQVVVEAVEPGLLMVDVEIDANPKQEYPVEGEKAQQQFGFERLGQCYEPVSHPSSFLRPLQNARSFTHRM